jgi:hypothetical protein
MVAAVITIFFGLGIAMGVLIVVALPIFQHYSEERRRIRDNRRRYREGDDWQEPPSSDDDRKPPPWPKG